MDYKFSDKSISKLSTCDVELQRLFREVIKHIDCTVIEGHRGEDKQDEYYRTGLSKVRYAGSKHNTMPSRAVDVAPYVVGVGIPWDDIEYFYNFAGFVKGVASQLGIKIRSGLDWDLDNNLGDQTFMDGPHFELI
jgi:peptidoglycan L-alanyl-D-glutamate endopeptidase CwlK